MYITADLSSGEFWGKKKSDPAEVSILLSPPCGVCRRLHVSVTLYCIKVCVLMCPEASHPRVCCVWFLLMTDESEVHRKRSYTQAENELLAYFWATYCSQNTTEVFTETQQWEGRWRKEQKSDVYEKQHCAEQPSKNIEMKYITD